MSGRTAALDWQARFQAERTPWERPTLNPAFVAWRASGELPPCRILLPGAGRSGESLALARDGFDVTSVDMAPAAVAVQQVRLQAAGLRGAVFQADLMDWEPDAPFDAIYDQTCLCALPPPILPEYVARLHRWLRPGGRLFILFMQTGEPGGPPFDCPIDAMRTLFAAKWQWPAEPGTRISTSFTDRQESRSSCCGYSAQCGLLWLTGWARLLAASVRRRSAIEPRPLFRRLGVSSNLNRCCGGGLPEVPICACAGTAAVPSNKTHSRKPGVRRTMLRLQQSVTQ